MFLCAEHAAHFASCSPQARMLTGRRVERTLRTGILATDFPRSLERVAKRRMSPHRPPFPDRVSRTSEQTAVGTGHLLC